MENTETASIKNTALMQSKPGVLSTPLMIAYAMGNLGWATLIHIIYTLMVYFYLPPKAANLPNLITDVKFFGVLNVIVIVAAIGRVAEVFTDPLIAGLSDRSKIKWGRRMPFMLLGFIPAALFCALIFMPPDREPTTLNLVWVITMQLLYYPFFSLYSIPHFALMIELTHNEKQRINIATFTSLAYALSSLTSAMAPIMATQFQKNMGVERLVGMQYAIIVLCVFSLICMLIPIIFIRETKYSSAFFDESGGHTGDKTAKHEPIIESLKTTFRNPMFRKFVMSDCVYWTGLNIVSTGMLYYITVLLGMKDDMLMHFMIILLASSFSFYPVVNIVAKRVSRKKLIELAFIVFASVFAFIFFLGKFPMSSFAQATIVVVMAAVPFAFLGILPNTVLADIAEHDYIKTGVRKEGMFFAARTMIMKVGQTFGIILFTILLSFGKEPGNDIGVRMSGIAGVVLCTFAALIFHSYNEKQILDEIRKSKKA